MRPDSDQSCTVQVLQRSTLMDLPTLPYRSVTDLAHTLVHSISISGPDLGQVLCISAILSVDKVNNFLRSRGVDFIRIPLKR